MCTKKLKQLLNHYDELGRCNGEVSHYTIDDVLNLESMFWSSHDHSYSANAEQTTVIPPASQRRLIEVHRLEARSREEMQLLIAESVRRVNVYQTELDQMKSQTPLSPGEKALSTLKCLHIKMFFHHNKLVHETLVRAYWQNNYDQALSSLFASKKSCKQEICLPSHPLFIDNSSCLEMPTASANSNFTSENSSSNTESDFDSSSDDNSDSFEHDTT